MSASIYASSDVVEYDTATNVVSSRPLLQTPASAATGVTQPSASAATGVTQPSDNIHAQIATSSGTSTARGGFTKNTQILAFASLVVGVLITFGLSIYSLKTAETEMVVLKSALSRNGAEMVILKSALARSEEETASLIAETASLKAAQETSDAKLANVTETEMVVLRSALARSGAEMVVLRSALARSEADTASLMAETASLKAAQETSDAQIAKLTEANQQTVLFTARDTDTKDITRNTPIIFPNVQTNLGGGYNRSSGIFTAPHSGSYLLTTTVCSLQSKQVLVQLVAAGTAIAGTKKHNDDFCCTCTSISGVAVLREGDTASVRAAWTYTGAMWTGGQYSWPSFAGMLVHKT